MSCNKLATAFYVMNILIILLLVFLAIFIFDSAKKKEQLKAYHKNNNASFVAEVEEFARWGELVFKEYCRIVGITYALSELSPNIELYDGDNGLIMPKITVKRRSCLGNEFRKVFDNFKNVQAIEALKIKYYLPAIGALQYDENIRKHFRLWGSSSIHSDYYDSLYQILYLNVYLSLRARSYNIGKNGIKEDEITEHKKIHETIKPYPWLSGQFKRY